MTDSSNPVPGWRGRLRYHAANAALVLVMAAVVLLCLEAAFRLVPAVLPAGVYGATRYSPALQMNVHGRELIYNKVRYLRRAPNKDGFMDVNHDLEEPPGVLRVGFFGDSYVESVQVPLDQVFFRRLDGASVDGLEVESLGFGMGGWGTVHALKAFQVMAPRYGIDSAVYVFVENDLGDNSYALRSLLGPAGSLKPYAALSPAPPGYELRWLPGQEPDSQSWLRRSARALRSRSLLTQVVHSRWRLLGSRGGPGASRAAATDMSRRAGRVPSPQSLPSSWPDNYASQVKELGFRLLRAWRDAARAQGTEFAVFYVPRSTAMLQGDYPVEETWRPWLGEACSRLGLRLIDPSEAMRQRLRQGDVLYDDHWTAVGHEVVADVLIAYLQEAGD